MKFTKDKLDDLITFEWFDKFFILFKTLKKNNATFFGGIVRDWIVPCHKLSLDDRSYISLKKIIDAYGEVELNDIDVAGLSPDDLDIIIDELAGNVDFKIWKTEILNDNYDDVAVVKLQCVYTSKLYNNKISINIDCVNHNWDTEIDFDVNCLTWNAAAGFSIIGPNSCLQRLLLYYNPEFIQLEEGNLDIKYFSIYSRVVDLVIDNITKKHAHCMFTGFNKIIMRRTEKLLKRGYKIIAWKNYGFCFHTISKKSDNCAICRAPFSDGELMVTTICNHQFKYGCFEQLIAANDNSAANGGASAVNNNLNEGGTTRNIKCPLCKKKLYY